MTTTVRARTARIAHLCDGCHWGPFRKVRTIAPGHRYLIHTAFPDREINQSGHPITHKECVSCAVERGREMTSGACESYCHGITPCALPWSHSGEHSCREDVTR
jgi:hypothetical protein